VHDTIPADHLLTYFRERRIHQAVVVGERGTIEGLITLEDVVAELLGGVSDEFKTAPARPILLPDGRIRLPGAMRIEQAAHVLGANWQSPGETLATFLTRTAGGLPAPGEEISIEGVKLIVEAIEGDTISSVLVLPPSTEETP
jgi:CBS domain containing-hemolysin-like protein